MVLLYDKLHLDNELYKSWYIFILFYCDYPYKGLAVTFFFNRAENKCIECSNFWPTSNFNTLARADALILINRLIDKTFKYETHYKTPILKVILKVQKW